MNAQDRTFDIDELAALTATPMPTIRFYIQEGLVPRPLGAGRGASYGAPSSKERVCSGRRGSRGSM